jgi:hypothetical protein
MTTLVTADNKKRICIQDAQPGRKYLVTRTGNEWRVEPYTEKAPRSRNRKEWDGPKNGRDIWEVFAEMGKLGLKLEESEESKQPVPPCRF